MPDIRHARRKLFLVLVTLLCIDVACGIVLISPIGRNARSSGVRLSKLWDQLQTSTRETVPLQGIDEKVKQAKDEIQQFYDQRLPKRFAALPDRLGELASQNGVALTAARYQSEDTDIPGIRRVYIDATLAGGYTQEARFINAVERDPMFFIIDNVALAGQEREPGAVRLQIRIETYIKSEAA